jgi:hypothetical protein
MARRAWPVGWGTWRLNAGDGAVLRHRPGGPGPGIMTELTVAPGQQFKCGRVLVSPGSRAHTGDNVVLLQTPAAAKTADNGVKLSAEASRLVAGIRSPLYSHGLHLRCGRHASGPMDPMACERHLGVTTSGHRP